MSSFGNPPDIDPANNGSLAGTLQFAFYKMMQGTDGMLPAQIVSYDRDTNRARIKILITMVTTNGEQVPRPVIDSIPVLLLGGGGYFLSFPLEEGDLGWIAANDRDISIFLQNYIQSPPNTNRLKNFSDGVFIPDIMTGYSVSGLDSTKAVLQSTDGTVKITLGTGEIDVLAPLVNINGIVFNSSGAASSTSPISITAPSISINGYSFSSLGIITPSGPASHFVGNVNATGVFNPGTP